MARVGIVFGLLLCALSAIGMSATVVKDPAQFIPMMLGIPILFAGVVSLNPHRRRIAMNSSLVIAIFGTLVGAAHAASWGVDWSDGEIASKFDWRLIAAMTWLCATHVIISFVAIIREQRRRKLLLADAALQQTDISISSVHLPPKSDSLSSKGDRDLTGTGHDVA